MKELIIKDIKENRQIIVGAVVISFLPHLLTFIVSLFAHYSPDYISRLSFAFAQFGLFLIMLFLPFFLAGSIFATEESQKTIASLFALPIKKSRIWFSKMGTVLILYFSLWVFYLLINLNNIDIITFGDAKQFWDYFSIYSAIGLFSISIAIFSFGISARYINACFIGIIIWCFNELIVLYIFWFLYWFIYPISFTAIFTMLVFSSFLLVVSFYAFIKSDYPQKIIKKIKIYAKGTAIALLIPAVLFLTVYLLSSTYKNAWDDDWIYFNPYGYSFNIAGNDEIVLLLGDNTRELITLDLDTLKIKNLNYKNSRGFDYSPDASKIAIFTQCSTDDIAGSMFYASLLYNSELSCDGLYVRDFRTNKSNAIISPLQGRKLKELHWLNNGSLLLVGWSYVEKGDAYFYDIMTPEGKLVYSLDKDIDVNQVVSYKGSDCLLIDAKTAKTQYFKRFDIKTKKEDIILTQDRNIGKILLPRNCLSENGKYILFTRKIYPEGYDKEKSDNSKKVDIEYILKELETKEEILMKKDKVILLSRDVNLLSVSKVVWINDNELFVNAIFKLNYFNLKNPSSNYEIKETTNLSFFGFSFSPDKSQVCYWEYNDPARTYKSNYRLINMDIKTHEKRTICELVGDCWSACWINNDEVIFLKDQRELYRVNFKTGEVKKIFSL